MPAHHRVTITKTSNLAFLCLSLLVGLVPCTAVDAQTSDNDPPPVVAQLSIAGLHEAPIKPSTQTNKDPVPCVPCDGVLVNFMSLRVDVSDVIPFSDDWILRGIYLVIDGEVYQLDRSTDLSILANYADGAYDAVVIEDFYGLITEGQNFALLFDFMINGINEWMENGITFQ